jgi:hypothetical protein
MAYYRFSLELITPAVNQRRALKSLHSRLASMRVLVKAVTLGYGISIGAEDLRTGIACVEMSR